MKQIPHFIVALLLMGAVVLGAAPTSQPAPNSRKLKADAPDDVKAYWEKCLEAKAEWIKRVEESLVIATRQYEQAKKGEGKIPLDRAKRSVEISQRKVADAKDPARIELAIMVGPREGRMGPIGYPSGGKPQLEVVKVIDDASAIVKVSIPHQPEQGKPQKFVKWSPVIFAGVKEWSEPGVPKDWTRQSWRVVGTKVVEGHTDPLFVLEPFDIEAFLEPVK